MAAPSITMPSHEPSTRSLRPGPLSDEPHTASQGDTTPTPANGEYRELRCRVRDAGLLAPQPGAFAGRLLVTGALLVASIGGLVAFHTFWGVVLGAVLLSVVSVQIAFLGHDAGHRQGFVRRWQNTLVGLVLSDVLLGASYGWWVRKHNAHHAHPNHADMDPDIDLPLIAFTPEQAMEKRGVFRFVAKYQIWFALPLLSLVAYAQRLASVLFLCHERSRYRRWEAGALLLNAVLFVGVPLGLLGPWSTLLLIAIHQACTGVYLGLVFAPNHKGMAMIDAAAPLDGLRAQVVTARNVRGHPITDWVYGGLNYQIEHHLFPSLSRNQLAAAQRIVSVFCRERGISYHETSVRQSYCEILASLRVAAAPLRTSDPLI
jgi:fatty acid desaturase